ncbi:MAG TPA: NAD+ synthase [Nitrospirota bacterium]|nr:NAD+ synthase [Nitrospirota bacterium]
MRTLRLAMAQVNCTVGDLAGNTRKIIEYMQMAKDEGADIVAFPELAITGYPPEDLLLKPRFIDGNLDALGEIAAASKGISAVVGFVDRSDDIYNAAAFVSGGALIDVYHKTYLPNYGVFDEYRYFQSGKGCPIYVLGGVKVGVNICEDIWLPEGPLRAQALAGAEVIININASPYYKGKWKFRRHMLTARAADNVAIVAYNNMVGGQDELVFDGHGMIFDEAGRLIAQGPQFKEALVVADLDVEAVFHARLIDPRNRVERYAHEDSLLRVFALPDMPGRKKKKKLAASKPAEPAEPMEEVFQALVLGTRDYVRKNGFKKVVVSLSGGIDSSLVAAVAVEALGKENVAATFFPFKFTSKESVEDTHRLAGSLGIEVTEIPIGPAFDGITKMLSAAFKGAAPDVTEENIQARIRGILLMALSNKFGWLVLTTGNKSEMSTGYATLYGDMAGGFAVIKDVPKTMVYELSRHVNARAGREIIPGRVLTKPPSAELAPGQKDSDTLPPYELLDPILKAYVEEDRGYEEMVLLGFDKEAVKRVIALVDKSEYKRRQSPPGIKITPRALGRDRRFPITNRYKSF